MSAPLFSSPFKHDLKKVKVRTADGIDMQVDRSIFQGATYRHRITWKLAPDQNTTPTPVDLTGCTARMQVRAKIGATEVLLTLTTENGGVTLGGTAGTIDLLIEAEDTAAITWTSGVYDLEIIFTNGDVRRLLYGEVVVSREVTRAA